MALSNEVRKEDWRAPAPGRPEGARKPAAKARRGNRKLAIIAAAFLLLYLPSAYNWISNRKVSTDLLRSGTLLEAHNADALVVRDDALLYSSASGVCIPQVADGDRAGGNSVVAVVYDRASEQSLAEYRAVSREILEARFARAVQGSKAVREAEGLESDIAAAVGKLIPDLNRNSLYQASRQASGIGALVVKKAEAYANSAEDGSGLVGEDGAAVGAGVEAEAGGGPGAEAEDEPEGAAPAASDAVPSALLEQQAALEARLSQATVEVTTPEPGQVSYVVDGFEQRLNPASVGLPSGSSGAAAASAGDGAGAAALLGASAPAPSLLSAEAFRSLLEEASMSMMRISKFASDGFEVTAGQPFAKVTRQNYFYLLVEVPEEYIDRYAGGGKVGIRVNGAGRELEAADVVACSGKAEDGGGYLAVRLAKYLYDFVDERVVNVDLIERRQAGIKIPIKCLRDYEPGGDSATVVLVKANAASFRKVRVVAANDTHAIIESYDAEDPKQTVSLYDAYVRDTSNIEDGMALAH